MNLFQIILLDGILLIFPILVYLIYLSTNKNINNNTKKIYSSLMLITSFFLTCKFGVNEPLIIPVLVLNSIVALSYLNDKYILANLCAVFIIFFYDGYFNNTYFLFILYFCLAILYLVKVYKKLNNLLFLEVFIIISSVVYLVWIYKYNISYYSIDQIFLVVLSYLFILNIVYLMYETGKSILETHLTFKELNKEKQIRLSLFKITHEIKNPIAVCKGYLDMINVKDQKQVERYIPILKSEIERLLSLLQDFLLINKSNLDLDVMDFNMLVEDTVDKLEPLLRENNIKLNVDMYDDEVFINGDYNRLSQVLINLIKNSIESISKDNDGKINLITKINNNNYCLILEDNGCGMSKEVLSNIKEPFFTTKKRGSGLGVSLIYEIVEAHNGKIHYESEYGKGTKVTIKLPLYE